MGKVAAADHYGSGGRMRLARSDGTRSDRWRRPTPTTFNVYGGVSG
jgi:hypothetical protein